MGTAIPLAPNDVFPDSRLTKYNEKKDRRLVRIGQKTTTIRADSAALIAAHVTKIKDAFKDNDQGKVFVYGSSSGGRNVLDLAASLTNEKVPIRYLATLDAAWFPNEAINSPDNVFGEPTNTHGLTRRGSFRLQSTISSRELEITLKY